MATKKKTQSKTKLKTKTKSKSVSKPKLVRTKVPEYDWKTAPSESEIVSAEKFQQPHSHFHEQERAELLKKTRGKATAHDVEQLRIYLQDAHDRLASAPGDIEAAVADTESAWAKEDEQFEKKLEENETEIGDLKKALGKMEDQFIAERLRADGLASKLAKQSLPDELVEANAKCDKIFAYAKELERKLQGATSFKSEAPDPMLQKRISELETQLRNSDDALKAATTALSKNAQAFDQATAQNAQFQELQEVEPLAVAFAVMLSAAWQYDALDSDGKQAVEAAKAVLGVA